MASSLLIEDELALRPWEEGSGRMQGRCVFVCVARGWSRLEGPAAGRAQLPVVLEDTVKPANSRPGRRT